MLTHSPQITLSFAVDEPNSCASMQSQSPPQLTEAQRLKAIESYALIAASYAVSTLKSSDVYETRRDTHQVPSPVYLRNSAPSNLKRLSQVVKPADQIQQNAKNFSSLGLSLRLQDTFRNYLRMRVPNQLNHLARAERHRPSRELRQMFTDHLDER